MIKSNRQQQQQQTLKEEQNILAAVGVLCVGCMKMEYYD
jgi:hypothetical protein